MAGRFGTITLKRTELATYRAAVISCAQDSERDDCERLLGQLASLEAAGPAGDASVTFTAPPGARRLASRALEHMRPERRKRSRSYGISRVTAR
jgi:hypothetical protein